MDKYYKLTFYLNARHSFDEEKEHSHGHTFTIVLYLSAIQTEKLRLFEQMNREIKEYLNIFQGKFLNELPEFSNRKPTVEQMGELFYDQLKNRVQKQQFELIQLEISENPLRIYAISNRLLLSARPSVNNEERWAKLIDQKKHIMTQMRNIKERIADEN